MTPAPTELDFRLLATRFPPGTLERSVRRVRTAEARIRRLLQEEERRLDRESTEDAFGALVRRTYGRLSSYVQEVDPDLETLRTIRRFRSERPEVDLGVPTVVVAGFPNVGKSSLVARLSSAKPAVAAYAFTTRAIVVGHTDLGFDRWQVVDTPGVLGREHRTNPAEREAIAAVGAAARVVLFVLDPSGTCGYPLEDQERLLRRWETEFPGTPIVAVDTKSDLPGPRSARLAVSATTGEHLEELRHALEAALRSVAPPPERAAPAVDGAEDEPATG